MKVVFIFNYLSFFLQISVILLFDIFAKLILVLIMKVHFLSWAFADNLYFFLFLWRFDTSRRTKTHCWHFLHTSLHVFAIISKKLTIIHWFIIPCFWSDKARCFECGWNWPFFGWKRMSILRLIHSCYFVENQLLRRMMRFRSFLNHSFLADRATLKSWVMVFFCSDIWILNRKYPLN